MESYKGKVGRAIDATSTTMTMTIIITIMITIMITMIIFWGFHLIWMKFAKDAKNNIQWNLALRDPAGREFPLQGKSFQVPLSIFLFISILAIKEFQTMGKI